jgi:hypothetical protein
LAGDTGACSAREDSCPDCAACGNGGFDVGGVAGQDDADWKLAVVRGIACVESAGCEIEPDFAANRGVQPRLKLAMGREALVIERRLAKEFGDLGRGHGHLQAVANWRTE